MEFPTVETFEQNKEKSTSIMKWREVPEHVIYHVKSLQELETKSKFGKSIYAELEDEEGNIYKTWLPEGLSLKLGDYERGSKTAFVKPKGLKQSKDHMRKFFDYDLMWC